MKIRFIDRYETYDESKGHGNPKEWKITFKKRILAIKKEDEFVSDKHGEMSQNTNFNKRNIENKKNCWNCKYNALINGNNCCTIDEHEINDVENECCDNFCSLYEKKISVGHKKRNCWGCTYYLLIDGKPCCGLDDHPISDIENECCDRFISLYSKKPKSDCEKIESKKQFTFTRKNHCWDCKYAIDFENNIVCDIDGHNIESLTNEGCNYYKPLRKHVKMNSFDNQLKSHKKQLKSNNNKNNEKEIIVYNSDLYNLKQENNYFRLIDKKTGLIKRIYKSENIEFRKKS